MKNICCWRKDIIIAKKFCAASERIPGPSTATAGYVGAEKGAERAHYLPPARGFSNVRPKPPAAALAALLSAHAAPGAASLATVPRGSGTKVAAAICRGWRPAHWQALISEHSGRPRGRLTGLPRARRRARAGTPSVRPHGTPPAGGLWRAGIV